MQLIWLQSYQLHLVWGTNWVLVQIPSASLELWFHLLSSEPVEDFDQTCIDTLLGGCKELNRFWWPWFYFQGHTGSAVRRICWKELVIEIHGKSSNSHFFLYFSFFSSQILPSLDTFHFSKAALKSKTSLLFPIALSLLWAFIFLFWLAW